MRLKSLTMLIIGTLGGANVGAAPTPIKITTDGLNVRTGPSINYTATAVVNKGQKYIVVNSQGKWKEIWYHSKTRWIHGDYKTNIPNQVFAKITADTLNVRSGPGTSYSDVGDALKFSKWAIIGCSGSWLNVWFKGAKRWIHKNYAKVVNGSVRCSSTSYNLPKSNAGFVQLPRSGRGFWASSQSYRQWARPELVYGLMRAADKWDRDHPNRPRIGIGSMSLENGGYLSPHQTHQTGRNADLQPVASTGYEGGLDIYSSLYSRYRTKELIVNYIKKEIPSVTALFNDPSIYNSYSYISYYSGHHNHFHLTTN